MTRQGPRHHQGKPPAGETTEIGVAIRDRRSQQPAKKQVGVRLFYGQTRRVGVIFFVFQTRNPDAFLLPT